MPVVLSSSQRHRIVYHQTSEKPSNRLIVTFAPKSDNFSDEGFGTRFALSRGHDTIYVAPTREAWHQAIDHDMMRKTILPVANGREIIAYGSSAGAYAALYFAGTLNARVLALAPRNDIHPIVAVDPALTDRDFVHTENLNDGPLSPYNPMIVFDPDQLKDAIMVSKWVLPAYSNAELRHVIRVGHNVSGFLQQQGRLGPLVEQFFSGEIPGDIDLWEENSGNWHFIRAFRLEQQGDLAGALKHAMISQRLTPHRKTLLFIIALAKTLGDKAIMIQAKTELNDLQRLNRKRKEKIAADENTDSYENR